MYPLSFDLVAYLEKNQGTHFLKGDNVKQQKETELVQKITKVFFLSKLSQNGLETKCSNLQEAVQSGAPVPSIDDHSKSQSLAALFKKTDELLNAV